MHCVVSLSKALYPLLSTGFNPGRQETVKIQIMCLLRSQLIRIHNDLSTLANRWNPVSLLFKNWEGVSWVCEKQKSPELFKTHRCLSTCAARMLIRFVCERIHCTTKVKISHALATLNPNNSVVYGQKHKVWKLVSLVRTSVTL